MESTLRVPADLGEAALTFLFLVAVVVAGCWIAKHLP
jgi:hypothetical protein